MNMNFYSLLDFYPKKETIKSEYVLLTLEEKLNYKKFVYSIPFEEEYIKDLIWEYLNDWKESMFELSKKYRIKKQKTDKRQQMYKREREQNESKYNDEQ